MYALSIENLGKGYKRYPAPWWRALEWFLLGRRHFHEFHWVLRGIDFTVRKGESVGILDPEAHSAVVYHPRASGPELTVERLAGAFGSATAPPRKASPALALPEPAARPTRGRTVAGVLHVPLPGVDLLLRQGGGVPTASLGLYRLRADEETRSDAGLGALTVRSAVRGATGVDAAGLDRRVRTTGRRHRAGGHDRLVASRGASSGSTSCRRRSNSSGCSKHRTSPTRP